MRKYLILIYLSLSVMSFAQFKADNVFDENQQTEKPNKLNISSTKDMAVDENAFSQAESQGQSSLVPGEGEQPENPGNPGEPVPINGIVFILLISAFFLIIGCQIKNKKINI